MITRIAQAVAFAIGFRIGYSRRRRQQARANAARYLTHPHV